MRLSRSRVAGALGVMIALAALSGCAPELSGSATAGSPSSSAPPTATLSATPPPPSPEERRHDEAVEIVEAATVRENAASIIMSTVPGTDAVAVRAFVEDEGLGGFILMGSNVPATPEELSAFTAASSGDPTFPILLGIDQEGGIVSRLPWDELPSAMTLKSEPPAATQAAFAERGALLSDAGLSVNFGIVADVTADPESFIFDRVLGTTPEDSAERVAAAVSGEQGLVRSTLKHFPGHGATPGNSHEMIPQSAVDRAAWSTSEALPFQAGIDAGAELLMYGHLRYSSIDALPASLSPEWHRIAREDLGFTGVIVTDDLAMLLDSGEPELQDPAQNAIQALLAGNDLLLHLDGTTVPGMIDGITAAVELGTVPEERLEDAAVRVAELRLETAEQSGAESTGAQ